MTKEFEIQGCVEVPLDLSEEEFLEKFIVFIESNNWSFAGSVNEFIDGYYINPDGNKEK